MVWHPSKMRSYFYPSERPSLERRNTILLARCNMSTHVFLLRTAKVEMGHSSAGLEPGAFWPIICNV